MKPILTVPTLHPARWVELPEVIVISAEWLAEHGGLATTTFAQHQIIDTEEAACPPTAPRPT